jgi:signal transduction histidine kinase
VAKPVPLDAAPDRESDGPRAKLSLVEGLLAEQEVRSCAVLTLRWLVRNAGVRRGFCAVVDREGTRLAGLTGVGVAPGEVDAWNLDLGERSHPLVLALVGAEPVAFHGSGRGRGGVDTPLGTASFYAVPLGSPNDDGDIGPGLLLVEGAPGEKVEEVGEEVSFAAQLLGTRLVSLWYRRAQADERRHKRERTWLFAILNAVTDPILLTDTDGRILVANSGAEALLSADETMSEGRRRAVALNNMLFSASLFTSAQESGPVRQELLLVDPTEGQDLLFELIRTRVKVRRGESGTVSILRNVTDLRRAGEELEENYRRLRSAEAQTRAERDRLDLILSSVFDPLLVTDAGGKLLLMNGPAERLFAADGMGAEAERRVRANDAVFTSFISNLYTSQSMRFRGELALLDPATGGTVPVEAISGKVGSRQGEDAWTVTLLHDLTEAVEKAQLYEQVKRHSEELREKVAEATAELAEQNELLRRQALELEQASAMKSQFLANVSHELRTPLNAIIGYTHLMIEGVSGALTRGQLDKMSRVDSNAQHLLAVINDLLDITRIESGKMPIQLETVRLPELIDEVMTEVEPLIARTRLQVSRQLSPDIPELWSDRKKVKQIVLNLLSNALKFTPEGSVLIQVEHAGERVSVSVVDTGIGISEGNQKTIFEAFGQADSSYARRAGGTGLGLSICRRLAAVLGGDITVASRQGEGSTFRLQLPLASGG